MTAVLESRAEVQLALWPVLTLSEVPLRQANALLRRWHHDRGTLRRPSGSQSWLLAIDDEPVAVAISAFPVSATAAGYDRAELVELARQASANGWANRVMIRLWREVCAPRWRYATPAAAISYSDERHTGDLYRFDGWELAADGCRSGGGGSWSRAQAPGDRKRLWLWRYS